MTWLWITAAFVAAMCIAVPAVWSLRDRSQEAAWRREDDQLAVAVRGRHRAAKPATIPRAITEHAPPWGPAFQAAPVIEPRRYDGTDPGLPGGWIHDDGTPCPEYLAPDNGTRWWCTTHEQYLRRPDGGTAPVIEPGAITSGPPGEPQPGAWIVATATLSGGQVTSVQYAAGTAAYVDEKIRTGMGLPPWVAEELGHDNVDDAVESAFNRAMALQVRALTDGAS